VVETWARAPELVGRIQPISDTMEASRSIIPLYARQFVRPLTSKERRSTCYNIIGFFFRETSCIVRENSDILNESPVGDLEESHAFECLSPKRDPGINDIVE
jgi:hypothetical protein